MPKKSSVHKYHNKKFVRNFFFALIGFISASFILNQFIDLNPRWNQPQTQKAQNGVLETTLNVAKSKVSIGGKEQESNVYNGKYIADTWEFSGGDTVKVSLENNSKQPTNLHFHGGHVSPKGNSDNVLLRINPDESFDYEYKIPENHPPGLYWYHPHLHHYTDDQVMSGMFGAIIVKGDIDELPGIKGLPERVLVLTTQDDGNTVARFVNGQMDPTLYVRPYETIRLRILNGASDDFYNLSIPGQKLNIISRDGNTLSEVQSVDNELMAPGDRIEILFKAGGWGTHDVKSLVYDTGFFTFPEDTFMKIKVRGLPVLPKKLPTTLIPFEDLRDKPVDRVRTLTFSEGGTTQNTTFLLDGKEFNPDVIDQVMTLGTTEEWKLVNKSGEAHPFHIHINPYQVLSVNGKDVNRNGYDDTFTVPPNGEVTIKTQYKDFDGKYVLHCHILFHEDHGMMQLVEVVKPGNSTATDNGLPDRENIRMDLDHDATRSSQPATRFRNQMPYMSH